MTFFFFFGCSQPFGQQEEDKAREKKISSTSGSQKNLINKQTNHIFFNPNIFASPASGCKIQYAVRPSVYLTLQSLPFTRFPFQNVSGECDKFGPIAAHHACQLSGSVHCSSHPRALLILLQLPPSSSEGLTPGSCCWLRMPVPSVFSLLSFPPAFPWQKQRKSAVLRKCYRWFKDNERNTT